VPLILFSNVWKNLIILGKQSLDKKQPRCFDIQVTVKIWVHILYHILMMSVESNIQTDPGFNMKPISAYKYCQGVFLNIF